MNPRPRGSLWSLRRYSQTPPAVHGAFYLFVAFYFTFNFCFHQASQNPQQGGGRLRRPGTGDGAYRPQWSDQLACPAAPSLLTQFI